MTTPPLLNLYAVLRDGVRLIRLDSNTQKQVSTLFAAQKDSFRPSGTTVIDFAPLIQLEEDSEDEVIRIEEFPLSQRLKEIFTASEAIPDLDKDDLNPGNVRALAAANLTTNISKAAIYFQVFDRRQLLGQHRFGLILSGDTYRRMDEAGVTLGGQLAAVYENGSLFFRSEVQVRKFLDLGEVFAPASNAEVEKIFGDKKFFAADVAQLVTHSGDWVRRRLTSIRHSGVLEKVTPADVKKAGERFGVNVSLKTVNGKKVVDVPSDKDGLKALIRLLNEDFFRSVLTDTKYRASGKVAVRE